MGKIVNYLKRNIIGLALTAIVLIIILLIALFVYDTAVYGGKVRVTIELVPKDARLTINGEPKQPGTLPLTPGKYRVSASKDGYSQFDEDIYINKGDTEKSIPVSLIARSPEAEEEAKTNREAYLKNEGIGGRQAQTTGELFRDRNPIVSKLPFKTMFYTIGYRADNSDPSGMSLIIVIEAEEGDRMKAVYQIERWGYDPIKMNIQFRYYTNPFNGPVLSLRQIQGDVQYDVYS